MLDLFSELDPNAPGSPEQVAAAETRARAIAEADAERTAAVAALEDLDLTSYDHILVMMSGGKDSLASLLWALERGAPRERLELWHHDIDGREGSTLMDWPVTQAYCAALGRAFGLPLYHSWKQGGFEREMLRENQPTAANSFETPDGLRTNGGDSTKLNTRRRFPQVSADLSVRWCSPYCKIDVAAAAINNQDRFLGRRTLVLTGERAAESTARARYKVFEPHRCDNRDGRRRARHVDHARPIHGWSEAEVWAIIERHRVAPHPAYDAGFGRVSCMTCIFMSCDQAATILAHAPERLHRIAGYEESFGCTIHRTDGVLVRAAKGTPYPAATPERMARCLAREFEEAVLLAPGEWHLPAGAFGESAGPT